MEKEFNGDNKKESFLLYLENKQIIDKLTDEQAGKLIKALFYYAENNCIPELDALLDIAIVPFKNAIDRNNEKWEKIKEKRSQAGKKGAEAKQANANFAKQEEAKQANANFAKQNLANQAVNVNVNDNVNVNVNENVNVNDNVNVNVEKIKRDFKNFSFNSDLLFDENINKVFSYYKQYCNNLVPVIYENRNKDYLTLIKEFLVQVQFNFEYIKNLFIKANNQKVFYKQKLMLMSIIKNHEKIYAGLGADEPENAMSINVKKELTLQEKMEKWQKEAEAREAQKTNSS